jgi:hypothetical protein
VGEGANTQPPNPHSSNELAVVFLTAILTVELRRIIQALLERFADCHTAIEVLMKIWALDEATFAGVVFLFSFLYVKLREHYGHVRSASPHSLRPRCLIPSFRKIVLAISVLIFIIGCGAGYFIGQAANPAVIAR